MLDWHAQIARELKNRNDDAQRKAVEEASGFIGTIESVDPIVVSIMGGALMYDEEDLTVAYAVTKYPAGELKAGRKCIVMPVDGLTTVALIDII